MADHKVLVEGAGNLVGLNAVTATGAGTTFVLPATMAKFGMQTVVTGAPTAVSVTLQGSLDGVNFFTLATSSSTTGDYQSIADKPVHYVRANLATLTGGTAPTVTARLACSI